MFAAACGDDDDQAQVEGVRALPSATCEPLEFGGDGEPDVLIASDLPMQGASSERSAQMVETIRLVLEENEWQAGGTRVAYQPCDDSVAKESGTRRSASRTPAPTPRIRTWSG
jgi:hypothetical protein